jgi:hypothetical protein
MQKANHLVPFINRPIQFVWYLVICDHKQECRNWDST